MSMGGYSPPLRFFVDSEKLSIEHFDTFPENFDLLAPKVTPPGHIK